MAEQFLNNLQVLSLVAHESTEGMAEGMPANRLMDAGKENKESKKSSEYNFAAEVRKEVASFRHCFKGLGATPDWNQARDEVYSMLGGQLHGEALESSDLVTIDQKVNWKVVSISRSEFKRVG
jgi:hypothetical protein